MWLEIFVALYFIVYPNRISCQPVTDSIRDTRQTNFDECCPCSRDDGTDFREPDMSPNSPMGSFTQEDDCPCRFPGIDSEGSPSIFRPFLLRNSHPPEREQHLKQKPLLQPEVGLASSVLETIQKATDEEYQEALEREAARSLVEIEPSFLDSAPDNSRNTLTIVLNPRDEFFDTDDAMPEASHVHETRCIHSPLGRSSLSSNDLVPRMSKQKLYLKRKPHGLSSKSLFDMDNSASNVKETFAVNNNDLSTKLRMNPLLLNNLPIKTGEVNDPMSKINSRYELRTVIPEHSNVFKNNELNSPKLKLAALKSRLRDLVEMRNINRMNNIPEPLRQNNLDIFNKKGDTGKIVPFDTNSPLDPLFENASPVLKNILKLKDVELLPPNELFGKHTTDQKFKLSDLNVAGSENDVTISNINEGTIATSTRKNSDSEEKVSKYLTEDEEKSTKNVLVNNSDEIHSSENDNSKDVLIEEMQRRLDDCLKSARRAQDEVNKNTDTDQKDTIDSFEYDSKEADDESEMEDSVAETSDNMNEQISHEEDNIADKLVSNLQQSTGENNDVYNSSMEQGNDGLATFKNDILRKLENIKKSIKSKLQDTNTKIYQPIDEKVTTNQDLSNLDLNSKNDQNTAVTLTPQPTNEKDITIQDLQNLSDSLLQQENKLKANTIPLPIEDETNLENNENQDYEPTIDLTNDEKSESSELDPTDTEEIQSEDDPISNETNINENEENYDPENSKYIYDKIDNDNDDLNRDDTLPKDSETNEMSSQASNSKYNAIIAPLSDKLGPTLQDTFSLFKTPIQIPSLEEIRQGITDIIDAGQKESEHFQTELDPLNESSNRNSVLSNPLQPSLPKSYGKPLTDRYLRPFQNTRNNIGGHKSLLDTESLKPLITDPFGYPSTLNSYPSASDIPNKILKASDATNIPSLDDITRFLHSQNHLKSAINNLPKTNLLKTPHKINSLADDLKHRLDTMKPEFKQINRGNQILGKPRLEANDFLQSMSRRHDDVKEKLQALHLDFNDRLASMYKRLNDQKLQTVNIPTFKAKENRLALPKSASKKEKFVPKLNSNSLAKLDKSFLSQPQTLQDTSLRKKPTPKSNSISSKNPLRNYIINPKTSTAPLIETEFNKHPNLSERHKIITNKQKSFKPISKVKISFTTPKPLLTSGSKLKNANPIKMPSRLSAKDRTADLNTNLKDISKSLRSRFQPLDDSNHAPSELIETKPLNEDLTNSQFGPIRVKNRPRINYKQADSDVAPNSKETQEISTNSAPKKTESPLISNLREALKARLQNITNTHTKVSNNPVKSTSLREDDAIVSPSNVKTSILHNPLVENTSYKCTMVCSKHS